jgi:hypothetical protein
MSGEATTSAGDLNPALLLEEVTALRERARTVRHAYWFPLVLFGLLILGATPFYVAQQHAMDTNLPTVGFISFRPVLALLQPGPYVDSYNSASDMYALVRWYWWSVVPAGYGLTLFWYRRHARRVGIVTPTRGFLVAGVVGFLATVLLELAAGWFDERLAVYIYSAHGIAICGIAAGLLVLAWFERSTFLAVAALLTAGAEVLIVEMPLAWAVGHERVVSPALAALPALVLLAGGAVALVRQRRERMSA